MGEEIIEIINKKNISSAKYRRLETYLQIIAISTSMILLAVFSWMLYSIRSILVIYALAFLVSYIVGPAVRFFEKRGYNRLLIVGLLYIIFVAIVVICAVIFLPMLWEELGTLQTNIQESLSNPEFGKNLMSNIEAFQEQLSETFPQLKNLDLKSQFNIDKGISGAASWILNYLGQLIKTITGYSGKILWVFIGVFLVPFITFFLLKDGSMMKRAFMRIIPGKYSETTLDLLQTVDHHIGRYIRGKIAESIILSIITIIGLRILNIKYYLVIGSIAGFANLVPYIGPVGIALPPLLLAFYQNGILSMVLTGLFLIGLQVLDNLILVPMIVGKSVDLHPIVTIFVVIVGGQTLGVLGMVAAVPIASIIISTFQAAYREFKKISAT